MREWLGRIGVTTLYIEPGSPWETGYCESFNSKLDELLPGEQFSTLHEAKVLIEQWRAHYNAVRSSSWLGYHPGTRDDLAASVCSALRCAPASPDAGQ